MNFGQGSIGFVNRTPAPAPATVADANNGLSLFGTNAQLGQAIGALGDPAQLLNNREIPLSGFYTNFRGNTVSAMIDDALALVQVLNNLGEPNLLIDTLNKDYALGDWNNYIDPVFAISGNIFDMYAQDAPGTTWMEQLMNLSGPTYGLFLENPTKSAELTMNPTLQVYKWGDFTNGPNMSMNLVNGVIDFRMPVGAYPLAAVIKAQAIGGSNPVVGMGDLDVWLNGTGFYVDDFNKEFLFNCVGTNSKIRMNGALGVTGTFAPAGGVNSITVNGGIVTAVS